MTKAQDYRLTNAQLEAIIGDETNLIANLSNAAALLFENLKDINWSGFYLFEEARGELVLGPFQGKVACIRIPVGRGVCGTAFQKKSLCLSMMSMNSQDILLVMLEANLKLLSLLKRMEKS